MFIAGFPAAAMGTNCYVIAPDDRSECIVVDPGIGVVEPLRDLLAEHHLKPAAVLLTHGHVDHVFSVTPVCNADGVPAMIHGDDAYRLKDPVSSLGAQFEDMLTREFGKWSEPDEVQLLSDSQRVSIAGIDLTVVLAPGHTEGSVLFDVDRPGEEPLCLSGDVLFAGSIGRTDLPGGSHEAMLTSLRTTILPKPDDTQVLPGHGPATTIGAERASNPFLRELIGR